MNLKPQAINFVYQKMTTLNVKILVCARQNQVSPANSFRYLIGNVCKSAFFCLNGW